MLRALRISKRGLGSFSLLVYAKITQASFEMLIVVLSCSQWAVEGSTDCILLSITIVTIAALCSACLSETSEDDDDETETETEDGESQADDDDDDDESETESEATKKPAAKK